MTKLDVGVEIQLPALDKGQVVFMESALFPQSLSAAKKKSLEASDSVWDFRELRFCGELCP